MSAVDTITAPPTDGGSALCLACGLCCTGSLYPSVALWPDELERAERFGLPVFSDGRTRRFRLPCPAHVDSACTVYAERPRVCAGFRCIALDAYLAGAIDLATGEAHAAEIKALMASVATRLPPEVSGDGPVWEQLRVYLSRLRADEAEAWRAANLGVVADIAKLVALCREHVDDRLGTPPDR